MLTLIFLFDLDNSKMQKRKLVVDGFHFNIAENELSEVEFLHRFLAILMSS